MGEAKWPKGTSPPPYFKALDAFHLICFIKTWPVRLGGGGLEELERGKRDRLASSWCIGPTGLPRGDMAAVFTVGKASIKNLRKKLFFLAMGKRQRVLSRTNQILIKSHVNLPNKLPREAVEVAVFRIRVCLGWFQNSKSCTCAGLWTDDPCGLIHPCASSYVCTFPRMEMITCMFRTWKCIKETKC